MKHLCDSNVFLAIAVGQHAHHPVAAAWFGALAETDIACFCQATRISFLRLLTQKIAEGFTPLTNREAWAVHDRLMDDDATGFVPEQPGVNGLWRQWTATDTSSPKVWMDSYLAAFAVSAGMRLVSFDKDFRKFVPHGLDLLLLSP